MNRDLENLAARAAPSIFVVLWSTGFIATKYVVHNADPLTYLAIRMGLVVVLMAVIVAISRSPAWQPAPPRWFWSTGVLPEAALPSLHP
jgi:drug/metabolite transporter (DMT)-like permease